MSLLLGNEAIVTNLKCQQINGTPVASFGGSTTTITNIVQNSTTGNHTISITSTPVITINTLQLYVKGTTTNIDNTAYINVYANTVNSLASPTWSGTCLQSDFQNGINIIGTGTNFAANTTYYIFVVEANRGGGFVATNVTTGLLATQSLSILANGYVGSNRVTLIGYNYVNIPSSSQFTVTYSIGVNAVSSGSQISIPNQSVGQVNYVDAAGMRCLTGDYVNLPITLSQLTGNNKVWIYVTNGTATAQSSFVPRPANFPSATITNAVIYPTTSQILLKGNAINFGNDFAALYISYNTDGTSATTTIGSISVGELNGTAGAVINTNFTFVANQTYYIYLSGNSVLGYYFSSPTGYQISGVTSGAALTITAATGLYVGGSSLNVVGTMKNINLFTTQSIGLYVSNSSTFSLSTATLLNNISSSQFAGLTSTTGTNVTYTNGIFTFGSTVCYLYLYESVTQTTSAAFSINPQYVTINFISAVDNLLTIQGVSGLIDNTEIINVNVNNVLYGSILGTDLSYGITVTPITPVTFTYGTSYSISFVLVSNNYNIVNAVTTGLLSQYSYPPAPLTSTRTIVSGQTFGNGEYIVSASSYLGTAFQAFNAFSGTANICWQSVRSYTKSVGGTSSYLSTNLGTNGIYGEYLQIQTPSLINITSLVITAQDATTVGNIRTGTSIAHYISSPVNLYLFGSSDGVNWILIPLTTNSLNSSFSSSTPTITYGVLTSYAIYNYFRLVVPVVNGGLTVAIDQMTLKGYDVVAQSSSTNPALQTHSAFISSTTRALVQPSPPSAVSTMTITASGMTSTSVVLTATNIASSVLNTETVVVSSTDGLTTLGTPTVAQLKAGYTLTGLNTGTVYNLTFASIGFNGRVQQFTTLGSPGGGYDIVIVLGQSNSVGSGGDTPSDINIDIVNTDIPDPRIKVYNQNNNTIQPAIEPINRYLLNTVGTSVNMGFNFAKKYLANVLSSGTRKVLIICAGVSGSSITEWQPGTTYLTRALGWINSALLLKDNPGDSNKLACVFWHQGETDRLNGIYGMQSDQYFVYLQNVINTFRTTYSNPQLPFLSGGFTVNTSPLDTSSAVLYGITQSGSGYYIPYTGYASSIGAAVSTLFPIHFSNPGLRTMGNRYYDSAYVGAIANTGSTTNYAMIITPSLATSTSVVLTSSSVSGFASANNVVIKNGSTTLATTTIGALNSGYTLTGLSSSTYYTLTYTALTLTNSIAGFTTGVAITSLQFPPISLKTAGVSQSGITSGTQGTYTVPSGYGNASGAYTITASVVNWDLLNAFDKVAGGGAFFVNANNQIYATSGSYNGTTGVYTGTTTTNGTVGEWIQIQMPQAITLTSYQITSANAWNASSNPKTFTMFASNDGTTWVSINTQSGIVWSSVNVGGYLLGVPGDVKSFTVSTSTAYQYYRLVLTANNGDSFIMVGDLTLLGY